MVSTLYSLHFVSITICIICLVLPSSNGADNLYKACSSKLISCGNNFQDIGYPFWGDGRPQYCGHPALQLQCLNSDEDDRLLLKFSPDDKTPYRVLNINYAHHNFTITLQEFQDTPCTSYKEGFSEVFQLSRPGYTNITLLYNCSGNRLPANDNINSFGCFMSSTERYQAYYVGNKSAFEKYASCKSFEVPVFQKELDDYNKGIRQLTDVVHNGFQVNYKSFEKCRECKDSKGTCGSSNQTDFVCIKNNDSGLSTRSKLNIFFLSAFLVTIGMVIIAMVCRLIKSRTTTKFNIFWKSKAAKCPNVDAFLEIYGSFALTRYTHASITKITNNFKDRLGEGGYAIVYKGKLLSGRLVAVKVLKQLKGDGEDFLNEVASISRTNHVNIVALLGFCFEGDKRALIYEFLPNGSLEKFTYHGTSASNQSLPWETVFNIVIGIARGLDYLHRGCNARILHFDIKPHNILLDEEFCPKISDFGLARLCPLQRSTISMSEARGTIGYIAPEVFCRTIGGVSHKSDVYSFGMMVLDMVCGRKNLSADLQESSEMYFPQWIYDRLKLENEAELQGNINDEEEAIKRRLILVSLWCIQTYPSNRPSMSRVIDMLQGCLELIEIPPMPNPSSPPRLAFLDTLTTLPVVTEISD